MSRMSSWDDIIALMAVEAPTFQVILSSKEVLSLEYHKVACFLKDETCMKLVLLLRRNGACMCFLWIRESDVPLDSAVFAGHNHVLDPVP
ncbi:hypothetical protein Cni_G09270 [Canna indica]|uniref:Uncharacterized protein n=1 Tax=Canna indica TaxID=4628 RepID=A0AAQ3K5C3_9LILI|nr:hypothetical protein Cni_G09270 [Canna indica]